MPLEGAIQLLCCCDRPRCNSGATPAIAATSLDVDMFAGSMVAP